MTRVNFDMNENDLEIFKQKVGYGNVSKAIRNFILSYAEEDTVKERVMRKKFEILQEQKEKLDLQYNNLKIKLESIDQKKKEEEIQRIEEEAKEKDKLQRIEGATMKANLHRLV